jgi:Ca2+-binding RTX toxin-like protein
MIRTRVFAPAAALAAGGAAAMLLAALLPSSGTAGTTTTGPTCNGQPADVVMGSTAQRGAATYFGDDSDEVIIGTEGDDEIHVRQGHDTVCGLSGDDLIVGGASGDDLFGENNNDTLRGRNGRDDLFGGTDQVNRGQPTEADFCFGGNPRPDTKSAHDSAFGCETRVSAVGGVKG